MPGLTNLPKSPKIALFVIQGIYAVSFIPWLLMAGLSFMAFDAPDSDKHAGPWLFVISIWCFPVVAIVGSALGWVFLTRGFTKLAIVSTLLPVAYGALWILAVFLGIRLTSTIFSH